MSFRSECQPVAKVEHGGPIRLDRRPEAHHRSSAIVVSYGPPGEAAASFEKVGVGAGDQFVQVVGGFSGGQAET